MKRSLLNWLYKEVLEQFCIIAIGLLWLAFMMLTARGLLSTRVATAEDYKTFVFVTILTIATTAGVVIFKTCKRHAKLQEENNNLKKELAEHEEFFGGLRLYLPKDADNN